MATDGDMCVDTHENLLSLHMFESGIKFNQYSFGNYLLIPLFYLLGDTPSLTFLNKTF